MNCVKKIRDRKHFAQSLQLMNNSKLSNQGNCGNKFHLFSNQGNSGNKGKHDNKDNVSNQVVFNVSRYPCKVSLIVDGS